MTGAYKLTGAQVLTKSGLADTTLHISDGLIENSGAAREIDLSGFMVLPGIVDIHGDAFEKHLAPRRGAMKQLDAGLVATEAELAANGITTGVLAQFYSWEGGMRGPDFATGVCEALDKVRGRLDTTLLLQLRFEITMLEDYTAVRNMIERFAIPYVVFNDHLPYDDLLKGKQPAGHVGKSLRVGRNPDKQLAYMHQLLANRDHVEAQIPALCADLAQMGVLMGSHDENTTDHRAFWRGVGAHLSEFPETQQAAEAAKSNGEGVILGAPNVVRGGSHKGNASAMELVALGLCDALASDYHYPSLARAAFFLADGGICDLAGAWALISSGPARLLGLDDRGTLEPGKRADLVVIDPLTRDVAATLSGGRFTFLRGEVGARFMAA